MKIFYEDLPVAQLTFIFHEAGNKSFIRACREDGKSVKIIPEL
jgi:hypothetical protein